MTIVTHVTVKTGAPQLCVITQFVYALYTNDCQHSSTATLFFKYAEDTAFPELLSCDESLSCLSTFQKPKHYPIAPQNTGPPPCHNQSRGGRGVGAL